MKTEEAVRGDGELRVPFGELMGHSSIAITQRYCHPTAERKIFAMKRLEAYNAEPQSQTEQNP